MAVSFSTSGMSPLISNQNISEPHTAVPSDAQPELQKEEWVAQPDTKEFDIDEMVALERLQQQGFLRELELQSSSRPRASSLRDSSKQREQKKVRIVDPRSKIVYRDSKPLYRVAENKEAASNSSEEGIWI